MNFKNFSLYIRRRLSEQDLEDVINILEDERKRRKLLRDDEFTVKNDSKEN